MVRVGLVDFDTSHVVAFSQRMNHFGVPQSEWVEGARVVAGCPGESEIMPERIPGYSDELKRAGIEIVAKPTDLLGKIDAVMIESQQGSRHLDRARPFLEAGLPTFIDKPFAGSVKEADAIFSLARKHNAPIMSCSALRYDPLVAQALAKQKTFGRIVSADVWGSASLHVGNPGLLHYGIHGVEMLYTLMGRGCRTVTNVATPQGEVATGVWTSGLCGVARGIRTGDAGFGLAVHYEKGHYAGLVEGAAFYREMLRRVVEMFASRKEPIDPAETREIMAFMAAALNSAERNGARVNLPG